MDKKVFVNNEIFESDGDYVIGGFVSDKVENFNLSDFKNNLIEKLSKLIDDYLDRAILYNTELGFENPSEKSFQDLSFLVKDNLGSETPFLDKETIIQTILNNDKTQKWVLDISERVKNYQEYNNQLYSGIYNKAVEMDTTSPDYYNAKYFSEEVSLEQVIEQLSIIEL